MVEPSSDAVSLLIVVTPHFNMAATMGFIDPLRAANYLAGAPRFRWTVASAEGGVIPASNGLALDTSSLAEFANRPQDIVLVSSSWTPEMHNARPLQAALRRWANRGAILVGLDTGAFILAEAGLLKGRRATVHYEHIDAMRELYPNVDVSEDLFVFDELRWTCCGGSAAVDFGLHVVKRCGGDALANAAARYLLHDHVRPNGAMQSPGLAEPLGYSAPESVKSAIHLMEQNLETPLSIPEICRAVSVSQRQLNRLFGRYVKKSPALYYRDIRLDRARGLVTQTEMPLMEIAVASGFSSQVHFGRAYRARFGLPPGQDRVEGRVPFEFRAWPMFPGSARA